MGRTARAGPTSRPAPSATTTASSCARPTGRLDSSATRCWTRPRWTSWRKSCKRTASRPSASPLGELLETGERASSIPTRPQIELYADKTAVGSAVECPTRMTWIIASSDANLIRLDHCLIYGPTWTVDRSVHQSAGLHPGRARQAEDGKTDLGVVDLQRQGTRHRHRAPWSRASCTTFPVGSWAARAARHISRARTVSPSTWGLRATASPTEPPSISSTLGQRPEPSDDRWPRTGVQYLDLGRGGPQASSRPQ
jgi:hypothetical protein